MKSLKMLSLGILFFSFSAGASSQTMLKLRSVFEAGTEPGKKTLALPSVWKCEVFGTRYTKNQSLVLRLSKFGDFIENTAGDAGRPDYGRGRKIVSGINMFFSDPNAEALVADAQVAYNYTEREQLYEGVVYLRETRQGNLVGEVASAVIGIDSVISGRYAAVAYLYCIRDQSKRPRLADDEVLVSDSDSEAISQAFETEN